MRRIGKIVAIASAIAAVGPAAAQAAAPSDAVVLVSGFTTNTPFTTSDPSCAGQEGPTWDPANGVAATLRANGYAVFTAPVKPAADQPATPCAPNGGATPPPSDYINSNGDVNANGQALGGLFAFLKDNYGVNKIDLVTHSDGGIWSRSAITQQKNFPGVTINSLTTLGTPHTGSFEADIAEDLDNGKCTTGKPIVKGLCVFLRAIAESVLSQLGPTAVKELSSDYMTTWNTEQTIGDCRVTGIAGTYFKIPLDPSQLPTYYNPSDVLVGQASALGQASTSIFNTPIPAPGIPNFVNGGSFPVVHSATFSWLSLANLLNTQAVSDAALAAVNADQSAGEKACTATSSPPTVTDGDATMVVPLHGFTASRHGALPRPRRGDLILHRSRARIFCRKRRLRSLPFLGDRKLRVTHPACGHRLSVRGSGRALMIRTRGSVTVEIHDTGVTVKLRGVAPRKLVLKLEQGESFVPVALDGSGAGTLPAGSGPTSLRLLVTPKHGARLVGGTTVSR